MQNLQERGRPAQTRGNRPSRSSSAARALALLIIATATTLPMVWWLAAPGLRDLRAPHSTLADRIAALAACALVLAWCWLLACLSTCAWDVARGPVTVPVPAPGLHAGTGQAPWQRALRPAAARLLTRHLLGAGLAGGMVALTPVSGALATPPPAAPTDMSWSGLPQPTRPLSEPARVASADAPAPALPRGAVTVYVVRPGDSLWAIARRELAGHGGHPSVSPTQVDHRWRQLYAANRERIGPEPDLITPGLKLRGLGPLAHTAGGRK